MYNLVLHSETKKQIKSFIARPTHAVILAGPIGIGKSSISKLLAKDLLNLADLNNLVNYPYLKIVQPDGLSISVDSVRNVIRFLKLKTISKGNEINRLIIIEEAHLMTSEAGNALLKILEEPPTDTIFILTTNHVQALLPTIRSRAQTISIITPNHDELVSYFANQWFKQADINQTLLMSGGLPGLMHALLNQNEDHPLQGAAARAREFLRSDNFARLCMVDSLSKQRNDINEMLYMLGQMSKTTITKMASNTSFDYKSAARWHKIQKATYDANEAIRLNAQPKLVLTNLILQL
jgi:replication-associated recombination protein RarA